MKPDIPRPISSFTATPPFDVRGRDGEPAPDASQYPLAEGTVRYVGEAVAPGLDLLIGDR